MVAWKYKISHLVFKEYFTPPQCSLVKYCTVIHSKKNFVSLWDHVTTSTFCLLEKNLSAFQPSLCPIAFRVIFKVLNSSTSKGLLHLSTVIQLTSAVCISLFKSKKPRNNETSEGLLVSYWANAE